MTSTLRWNQRLDNFQRSMRQLDATMKILEQPDLSELKLFMPRIERARATLGGAY